VQVVAPSAGLVLQQAAALQLPHRAGERSS
jgi:hypothetical protein